MRGGYKREGGARAAPQRRVVRDVVVAVMGCCPCGRIEELS